MNDLMQDGLLLPTAALDQLAGPALDLVFMRPTRIGVPSAWYGHVPFAHWLVGVTAPRRVVELGSHNGVSYAAFCEAVARTGAAATCTAIDTWAGDEHAGFYGDEIYDDLKQFHDPRYGGFSTMMRCTFDAARPFFADNSVDLLHIDGLHTYEAVRHDWENWRATLSDRAVVLFHDVNERQSDFGVWRLWDELRAAYPSFTFLHSHGLGVLAVGTAAPQAVLDLCAADAESAACSRLRDRFAQLGERWDAHAEHTDAVRRRQVAEAAVAGLTHAQAADAATAAADLEILAADVEEAREERQAAWDYQQLLEDEVQRIAAELAAAHAALAQRAEDWERVHVVLHAVEAERDQARAKAAELAERAAALEATASHRLGNQARQLGKAIPGLAVAQRTAGFARMALSGGLAQRRALRQTREAEIAALRGSPLFDQAFYVSQHPNLQATPEEAVGHYIWIGAAQGAMPNPYFDGAWYRSQHPEAQAENPLLHWQRVGAPGGHDPNPFLDARWYVERNPEAAADPLLHYIQVGAPNRLDPNPMLDGEGYLLEHAHARQSGLDALRHWWVYGAGMSLDPNALFDVAWYRAQNRLPEGSDVLAHWRQTGQQAGLGTSPLTDGAPALAFAFADQPDPEVTIVIPVYGHPFDTIRCLYSLATRTGTESPSYDVLVADDNPACRIAPLLQRRIPGLRTVENEANLGFLRSCNNAVTLARGRVVVLLNNDTTVHAGWLAPLMDTMARHPDVGMVGCKMLNRDGTLQEAGVAIPSNGWGIPYGAGEPPDQPAYDFVREVDAVVGACIAVRRDAWNAVGGFDDEYAPAFYEEFDMAFAMRAKGWRVMYQPLAVIDHLGSNSYGAETRDRQSAKNHAVFCRKWSSDLAALPPPDASPRHLRQRPHDCKTVLFVDDKVPEWDRHAGALTNKQYIGLWQQLGYHVVLAPAAGPRSKLQPYAGQLQQEGVEVLHGPGALEAWLAKHGDELDVVWIARPDVTAPLLGAIRASTTAPVLYYPHDIHHIRERKRWELDGDPRALSEAKRLEVVEKRIFNAVDCVLCISETEAQTVTQVAPSAAIQRVPAYIYPAPAPPPDAASFAVRDCILFVGGYAHLPNVDAARFLVADVMPLVWAQEPAIKLVLAGSAPTQEIRRLAGSLVEVPGFVADLAPYNDRARISINPLRYGAGVKGKVVAALWGGLPVVSTPTGVEGLALRDGTDCLIAETAADLAACIVTLWRDPARCAAIGLAGAEAITRNFGAATATRGLSAAIATAQTRARARAADKKAAARPRTALLPRFGARV